MKKWLAILMVAAMCMACFSALAEEAGQEAAAEGEVFPTEVDQDWIVGRWTECETQFTEMTVEKNPAVGWDVVIASPLTHGAYIFKTTVRYNAGFYFDAANFLIWDDGKENAGEGRAFARVVTE